MLEELEKMANLSIPKDLASEEANKYLIDACAKYDVKCPAPQTTTRLLDKVSFCFFIILLHSRALALHISHLQTSFVRATWHWGKCMLLLHHICLWVFHFA